MKKKFAQQSKSDEFVTHSKNGWTTSSVIIKCFKWPKKMDNNNFALILDVYKSNINKYVKREAKKLGIKLIFVPASGTSLFQPLDIKIFGIVKEKLIKMEKENPIEMNKDRFKTIKNRMISTFKDLTNKSIDEAWKIPSLNKLIINNDNDNDSSEFLPEEEEDSDE